MSKPVVTYLIQLYKSSLSCRKSAVYCYSNRIRCGCSVGRKNLHFLHYDFKTSTERTRHGNINLCQLLVLRVFVKTNNPYQSLDPYLAATVMISGGCSSKIIKIARKAAEFTENESVETGVTENMQSSYE